MHSAEDLKLANLNNFFGHDEVIKKKRKRVARE